MAFDFKGGKQVPKPGSTPSSNNDYSSSLRSVPRPSGSSFTPSSGFQNTPTARGSAERPNTAPSNLPALNDRHKSSAGSRKTPTRSRYTRGINNVQIPWRIVLLVIAAATIVILCVVFREAITEFLAQLLAWVIIVLIIIAVVKWLIFPNRRR